MQPVDYTTLAAACWELRRDWLPARLEQVYQRDRFSVCLCLRTLERRGWLTLSWHPQAARLCVGEAPPREPDTFTFSQQLLHQLKGLALVAFAEVAPWERVTDLQFARRPGDPVQWHLYAEIMGKYSNAILTDASGTIVTAAHQVSDRQSSVRPIQTGQPYQLPPALVEAVPRRDEPRDRWQERVSLVPEPVAKQLRSAYRGLSTPLARSLLVAADLPPDCRVPDLAAADWDRLFAAWQAWLKTLETGAFDPGWLPRTADGKPAGYTVLGWGAIAAAPSVQALLDRYYRDRLAEDAFQRLQQQLRQKLASLLAKQRKKTDEFRQRLAQSDDADRQRQLADLLMAHPHAWQPGLETVTLADFETGEPVAIPLDPVKNAIQNAQNYYKKHRKLKRSRQAVEPLLAAAEAELAYLEQVEAAVLQGDRYRSPEDLAALESIRDELVNEGYLPDPGYRRPARDEDDGFHRHRTPGGFEIWVGRNNAQNDRLTFRLANDYDLWFHTQEIPGSHLLLRLDPGAAPDRADLQAAADLAAYYSRARQSDAAPVVYTHPKHVYKPKGAKPGMAIYKHETVLWGNPRVGERASQLGEI